MVSIYKSPVQNDITHSRVSKTRRAQKRSRNCISCWDHRLV